ncbi:hypothetical protein DNK10_21410 [Pseudomonas daroniae]|nr:hypothetical protein DNK10_21410 [Pseudomonas daroniae]
MAAVAVCWNCCRSDAPTAIKNCREQFLTSPRDGPQGGRQGRQAIKNRSLAPVFYGSGARLIDERQ